MLFGVQRVRRLFKGMNGPGRKRQPWVLYVHDYVLEEFHRLPSAGLKITRSVLRDIAVQSLIAYNSPYSVDYMGSGKNIIDMIDGRFIARFCVQYDIVERKKCGKKPRSAEY